jgi:SAM-dependent methyltransferase
MSAFKNLMQKLHVRRAGALDFERRLRDKWREVPSNDQERAFSSDLLRLDDEALLRAWKTHDASTATREIRGWYRERYQDVVKDRDILDFGCGFSVDGIHLLQHGARVTFADIVEDNIRLVERVVGLLGLEAEYYFVDDLYSFRFRHSFDYIFAIGSLIHAPFEMTQKEVAALEEHLKVGGAVLFFGYPHERFVRSGARDGADFARTTDGERTPWAEWYDGAKICALFGERFELEFERNFGPSGIDFNWFELKKLR